MLDAYHFTFLGKRINIFCQNMSVLKETEQFRFPNYLFCNNLYV